MTILDSTIVNAALPSMRADLGLSDSAISWVVNGYLLTFGGLLILAGRLGDLLGHRRLFLGGVLFLTLASVGCALSRSEDVLIGARALQGAGGAVVSASALALIGRSFRLPGERTRAISVYGFVGACAGSLGLVLGGLLTSALDWHWIFLVNVPIGSGLWLLGVMFLREDGVVLAADLDAWGALTGTTSLTCALYAIVGSEGAGWTSPRTLLSSGASVVLFALFLGIESRVRTPILPRDFMTRRNVAVVNLVGALWAGALFAWTFFSALYLQRVLGYSPWRVSLVFLPANVISAVFTLGVSGRLVGRLGVQRPLVWGLLLAAAALALLGQVPVNGKWDLHVLPGFVLFGLGCGVASTPLLLAALNGVASNESGLASGVFNTSLTMGGALVLTLLARIAADRTDSLLAAGDALPAALTGGYHVALFIAAALAATAALMSATLFSRAHLASAIA